METTLIGATGLLLAGALTPGPNNFVVLHQAARAGWRGVAPAIAGIVGGSLALLLLVAAGVGALVAARPELARWIGVAGAAYLAVLGLRLTGIHRALPGLLSAFREQSGEAGEASEAEEAALPAGLGGLLVFQFLNPKAWLLTLTVVASVQSAVGGLAALPPLALLYVVVPTLCLLLWSVAGRLLGRLVGDGPGRRWFDRAMGLLLILSAALLLSHVWS